ncbi:fungal zn(2)-Cys(6) binuclear cluster domain-containing protein [Rhizoctonia solani AG-1 IA]|uniref:Fungal zn(2)-Cys(6) binuclear cluster domain-containing protein n=1 Tax=Thanatephorus cucumeris (strain AG1-IA) TaxID=983506 RepID=L8WIK4_THACA|nr:fungal zn(2)-Cys(6) binuclear cluster domain-containing protein [Rhizoctonia solani AG-1 IA]
MSVQLKPKWKLDVLREALPSRLREREPTTCNEHPTLSMLIIVLDVLDWRKLLDLSSKVGTLSNKTCDRTRPSCKRCAQVGVQCEGYPQDTRNLKHNRALSSTKSSSNLQVLYSSVGHPYDTSHALEPISYAISDSISPGSYSSLGGYSIPPSDPSLFVPNPDSISLGLSPASSSNPTYYSPQISNSPGQSHSLSPASYSSPQISATPEFSGGARLNLPSQAIPTQHWPTLDEDSDSDDLEDVRTALSNVLVMTGNAESESLVDCFALWMIRFLFEPLRGISTTKDIIIQGLARGGEALWRMMLQANIAWQVAGNAQCDIDHPPYFSTFYSHIIQRLSTAKSHIEPSREMDRCYALSALEQSFEIGTLSDILNAMQHAAPVFRRACSDSPEKLVNLPLLLTTVDISLQSYATHDILFSMLTHRPMFFRYDLSHPAHVSESLFNAEDGPGLRWLYGVPDWLMVILARMNTLLEDYGSCVDPGIAKELEEEIRSERTIVAASVDPSMSMGRIVVQESWRLAALIYLFMALCGADSKDARVSKVHSKFMKLYTGVEARRNPDSFLVFPMLILGLPTSRAEDRTTIRSRMLGLQECSKPNTFGNEVVRILDDIWSRADARVGRIDPASAASHSGGDTSSAGGSGRTVRGSSEARSSASGSSGAEARTGSGPVVWSDLRLGCLRVTGM